MKTCTRISLASSSAKACFVIVADAVILDHILWLLNSKCVYVFTISILRCMCCIVSMHIFPYFPDIHTKRDVLEYTECAKQKQKTFFSSLSNLFSFLGIFLLFLYSILCLLPSSLQIDERTMHGIKWKKKIIRHQQNYHRSNRQPCKAETSKTPSTVNSVKKKFGRKKRRKNIEVVFVELNIDWKQQRIHSISDLLTQSTSETMLKTIVQQKKWKKHLDEK